MGAPLVSVLMPVRNEEQNVSRAIDSVLRQTYDNWELVIVDDYSTDRTPEILERYAEKDPRIRVVRNERHLGITRSLNRGIGLCRGKYIARLDADDWYHPLKLERQVEFLEKHGEYGMVGCFFILVCEDGRELRVRLPVMHEEILRRMAYRNSFCHSCVVFRKDVLDRVGYYDERLRYAQDYDLYFRIMAVSKVANIPEYLCYRRHRKHSKKRMLESTLNSMLIPLKHWRVLGPNVIFCTLLLRRLVTAARIALFY